MHKTESNHGYYIGLMCGTSIDGVDVALVEFKNNSCRLIENYLHPISLDTKNKLRSLCSLSSAENHLEVYQNRIELLGELDTTMGQVFADSVNVFLEKIKFDQQKICAIGSHGQTIRHQPSLQKAFTLQIGDPAIIAYKTGITTVADFRRMDIAAGGQGAPLAPAFHNAVLRSTSENRIILNLGGIANITYLPKDSTQDVMGFDTGTANTLMDVWFLHNHPNAQTDYDRDAQFAQQGKINQTLLKNLCAEEYFELTPPKSTGREYFSIEWLNKKLQELCLQISAQDIQRTLLEFSAVTISDAIKKLNLDDFAVYTCGGGTHNKFFIQQIEKHLNKELKATDVLGISGDYLEAMTFAWLAHQRINKLPGNLPSVTGANEYKILGGVYLP